MNKLPPLKRDESGSYIGQGYRVFKRMFRKPTGGLDWSWAIRLDHWEPGQVSEGFSTKADAHRSALDYLERNVK